MINKNTFYIAVSFLLGILLMFSYQQQRIKTLVQKNNADMKQEQRLFDIDQQMILVDVNAYKSLQHCYDYPKICNIFDPNGQTDQIEMNSMQLAKEKQTIITKNPSLIPEQYRTAWGVK